jgi:hypothetical protein
LFAGDPAYQQTPHAGFDFAAHTDDEAFERTAAGQQYQNTCSLDLATAPGITDELLINQWLAGQLSLKGGRWLGLAFGF